jgi:hypothetical protein
VIDEEFICDMPSVGDQYDHPTGVYVVDWVCGDEVGLCGESLTWTGLVVDLGVAGFTGKKRDDDNK